MAVINGKTLHISTISRKNRGLWIVSPRSTLECLCVSDRIGIWESWFLRRGETGRLGEKSLGARERTNNKLNPHMTCRFGMEISVVYHGVIYKTFPENPIGKWVNGTRRFGSFQRKISGSNGISEKVVLFSGRNVTKVNFCSIVKLQFFIQV